MVVIIAAMLQLRIEKEYECARLIPSRNPSETQKRGMCGALSYINNATMH
jgi:uncharacterized protein YaeQ